MRSLSYLVKAIPLFKDNYSYFVALQRKGVLIDPASLEVLSHVSKDQVAAVIYTHKHWDHAGSSAELRQELKGVPFYAGSPDNQVIKTIDRVIQEDCKVEIQGMNIKVLKVPCHTKGHICLNFISLSDHQLQRQSDLEFRVPNCCFTGDTLFLGGCGKFFEGSHQDMFNSLAKIKKQVQPNSYIFPGHEYTLANYKWASSLESECKQQIRKQMQQTRGVSIPGLLSRQLEVNLFLRSKSALQLKELREHKNNFG